MYDIYVSSMSVLYNFGVQVALASLAVSGLFLVVILDIDTSGKILVGLTAIGAGVLALFPNKN